MAAPVAQPSLEERTSECKYRRAWGGPAKAAILDCDEIRTDNHLTNWLAGLGYRGDSYPVVQSAHRDRMHMYATLSGCCLVMLKVL